MIRDEQLGKTAFAMTIIGIAAIYFLANIVGPQQIEISEISIADVGKQVVVNGTVVSSRVSDDGHLFMELTDFKKNITVVVFERDASNIEVPNSGDKVTATGQVNTYKSVLEIIAKTVIKWK